MEATYSLGINKDTNLESNLSIQHGGSNRWHRHGSISLSRDTASSLVDEIESERISVQHGGSNRWHRHGSLSLSRDVASSLVDEIESERIAEAGDDGGRRSLHGSSRREINENIFDLGLRGEGVIPNDALIYPYPFQHLQGDSTYATTSPVSPLASDIVSSPFSDHPLLVLLVPSDMDVEKHQPPSQVNQQQFPYTIKYILILAHLAIFGIIGVLTRYGLQVLFGPKVANVTNNLSPLYLDLPSNMVGSFFMGWTGVVFKNKISLFSEALATGLSTGLMGSITTFSAWIETMINLSTKGQWMMSIIGLIIGLPIRRKYG